MAIDVYDLCPCGSGKKLKFCCAAIIDEMAKINRLQANDQPRQALAAIEKIEKSNPDNPWVGTVHAEVLLSLGQIDEAQARLEQLLKAHPDHPYVVSRAALVLLLNQGYRAAQPTILRAFQKCFTRAPEQVGLLALTLYDVMNGSRFAMAARQYLTVAMRLLGEKSRENTFLALLKLDGDARTSYPLRSVQNLAPYAATGPNAAEANKAAAIAKIACYGPAGRTFAKIAEQEPNNAELWRNVALCRAWDADEPGAAEAFHKAAAVSQHFEFAVECETLAQLLDLKHASDRIMPTEIDIPIRSASRLLGLLEGNELYFPLPVEPQADAEGPPIAARRIVLDKTGPKESESGPTAFEDLPSIVATLTVFDAVPEQDSEAVAVLTGLATADFERSVEDFQKLAGDEITKPPAREDLTGSDVEPLARELAPYFRRKLFSAAPGSKQRAIQEAWWRHLVDEVWWNAPQAALGGKSPSSVAGDAQYRVRLTAAVYVLDALSERLNGLVDLDELLARLGLQPLKPLSASEPLSSLSPMQLQRLPIAELSDAQLVNLYRRAAVIGQRRFATRVMEAIVDRPACLEQVGADRVFEGLLEIAHQEERSADAIAWAQKGREHAARGPQNFERVCKWTMTEFLLRADQPDDPELPNLFRTLSEYYAPKVPEVGRMLEQFVAENGDKLPWLRSAELLVGSGAAPAGAGGLWTPSGVPGPASSSKKIWLPGQE
ncbi:MAG TPA: tetratricopeptide repeat protein [Planctomycetaceae bacterium]|jgi:Flp pilus assembly protein TadD|nr:tetratricopeptide repeat protein [Planctomycetaceae bacterium]